MVTPNVVGMGDGGMVGIKPYAASANYIHKMSTYCEVCRYDPKQRLGEYACPFNALYRDFVCPQRRGAGGQPAHQHARDGAAQDEGSGREGVAGAG